MADLREARDHIRHAQVELEEARRLLSADMIKSPSSNGRSDVEHGQLVDLHRKVSDALSNLMAGTRR